MDGKQEVGPFWDDLIPVKEACAITQLERHAVVWRVQKQVIRGKRIGSLWVVSKTSAEHYAREQETLREIDDALTPSWDDLISLKEACIITQLSDDAMLLRLQKQEVIGKLIGMVWTVSQSSAEEYARAHVHEPRKKPGARPGSKEATHGRNAIKAKYGPDVYKDLAQKGGQAMRQKYAGTGYYQRVGRAGGEAVKQKYGLEHYRRIGRMHKRNHPPEEFLQQEH